MPDAVDTYGTVFKDGSATFLARVVDAAGEAILQAVLTSIKYTIYLLREGDPNYRLPVQGHSAVVVPVASVIFDTLQNDATWTADAIGYNFRHTPDVSADEAFLTAGRRYLVVYQLAPASGQVVLLRFRVSVI